MECRGAGWAAWLSLAQPTVSVMTPVACPLAIPTGTGGLRRTGKRKKCTALRGSKAVAFR